VERSEIVIMSEPLVTIPAMSTKEIIAALGRKKSWVKVTKDVATWDFMEASHTKVGAIYRMHKHRTGRKMDQPEYARFLAEKFAKCVGCPAGFFAWTIEHETPFQDQAFLIPDPERALKKEDGSLWSLSFNDFDIGTSVRLSPIHSNGCGPDWIMVGFEPVE